MEIFITLAQKIIFPEMEFSDDYNIFKNCTQPETSNKFIGSIYKFLIIHNHVLKMNNVTCFDTQYNKKMRKFDFLKRNIENIFFTEADKIAFLDYFNQIQKHYFAFIKLCNIWKYKRSCITVSDDLYLNPIDIEGKNVFVLVQNKKKYLFSIANLINMVNTSLSNTYHFFASPLILKNPYSNIILNKADLYNLYFAIKKSSFIMPVLYHYYFLTNFDITKFREQNEGIIRDISIKNHIKNSDNNTLYSATINMLKEHKKHICIHPDFPKEELVNIMKPYLHLYYVSMYSLDEYKKLNAFSELHKKLHKFYKFNPRFGRKTIRKGIGSNFENTKITEFNNKHVKYCNPVSVEDFMKSHEKCSRDDDEDDDESDEDEDRPNNNDDMFRVLLFQNVANTRPLQTQVIDNNYNGEPMDIVPYDNTGYSHRYSVFDEDTVYREIIEDIISENEPPSIEAHESSEEDTISESESDEVIIKNDSDSDAETDTSE